MKGYFTIDFTEFFSRLFINFSHFKFLTGPLLLFQFFFILSRTLIWNQPRHFFFYLFICSCIYWLDIRHRTPSKTFFNLRKRCFLGIFEIIVAILVIEWLLILLHLFLIFHRLLLLVFRVDNIKLVSFFVGRRQLRQRQVERGGRGGRGQVLLVHALPDGSKVRTHCNNLLL